MACKQNTRGLYLITYVLLQTYSYVVNDWFDFQKSVYWQLYFVYLFIILFL